MNRRHVLHFAWLSMALITFSFGIRTPSAMVQTPLTVSAAVSLSEALQEIKSLYQRSRSVNISYNFGASGALQQQISQGAPVDVFFSAATKQMDTLQRQNLLVPGSRRNLLNNRLVLITPRNAPALRSIRDLSRPQVKRIAIGEPKSVPAGQYAQEVLTNLRLFSSIKPKLIYASNVRQVLSYAGSGNVDAGFVYFTDARASNSVRVGVSAPENLHSPIVYPVAALKNSKNATAARQFVQFLAGAQARAVFQKYGFRIAR